MRDIINKYDPHKINYHDSHEKKQNFFEMICDIFLNYEHRLSRVPHIIALASLCLITYIMGSVTEQFFIEEIDGSVSISFSTILFFLIFAFILGYNHFVITIKRLHDLNKPGLLSFIYVIPLINIVFMLYLIFKKGDEEENNFGPPCTHSQSQLFTLLMILVISSLFLAVT